VNSLDGKLLYYSKNQAGKYSLWQVAVEGGEEQKVLDGLADIVAFRPVEDGIYIVAEGQPPSVQFYDFRTRHLREIARLPKPYLWGLGVFPLKANVPRTLLVNLSDQTAADLVLIENLR